MRVRESWKMYTETMLNNMWHIFLTKDSVIQGIFLQKTQVLAIPRSYISRHRRNTVQTEAKMDKSTLSVLSTKLATPKRELVNAKRKSEGGQLTLTTSFQKSLLTVLTVLKAAWKMCWASRVHCALSPQLKQILPLKEHRVLTLWLRYNELGGLGSFSVAQMFYEPYIPELDESGASVGP